jgi:hypothetical protein
MLALAVAVGIPSIAKAQAAMGAHLSAVNADSLRHRALAQARVTEFVAAWRRAWIAQIGRGAQHDTGTSDVSRWGRRTPRIARPLPWTYDRLAMATAYNRCIAQDFPWFHLGALSPVVTRMSGPSSARGYCPGWSFYHVAAPEARLVVDSTLPSLELERIRQRRDEVIAMLDSVATVVPEDEWVIGQRVRMLVDQERFAAATSVSERCVSSRIWCGLLRGFAQGSAGSFSSAAREFNAVQAMLGPEQRCAWESVVSLLHPTAQVEYVSRTCAEQHVLNERFWWLAKPLWSDSVNMRRVEHDMRRVQIALRSALPLSELFTHTPAAGRDALHNVLLRYGWPSTMTPAPEIERANDRMLEDAGTPPSPPYAMLQYQRSRVHVAPAWRALLNPLQATSGTWTLHEPDTIAPSLSGRSRREWEEERGFLRLNVSRDRLASVLAHSVLWWPAEHFEPSRPLVQLPDPQVALLRRDRGVHVAVAASGDDPLSYPDARFGYEPRGEVYDSAGISATALLAYSPDSMQSLGTVQIPRGRRAIIRRDVEVHRVDSLRALLGIEVRSVSQSGADARTRFSIAIPPPLTALRDREIELSSPVLLHGSEVDARTRSLDAILSAMRSEDVFPRAERLGVYWESYGVAPSDTITVNLRIANVTEPDGVRRVATALRLADDPRGSLAIQWREPSMDRVAVAVDGSSGRATGRLVLLDLSTQPPGEYMLSVEIVAVDGRRAAATRRLWLR